MTPENLIFQPQQQNTRSDAVKNRALLLDTARRLFEEKGAENVTMSAVAEAAGVGKGTLYRHFETKADLAQALLDSAQRDLQERTFSRLRQGGDPLDNLHWFMAEALTFVERNRPMLCASTAQVGTLEHPAHWWWRQTIRGLAAQSGATGDLDYIADMLYIMLDVRTLNFQEKAHGYTRERTLAAFQTAIHRLLIS